MTEDSPGSEIAEEKSSAQPRPDGPDDAYQADVRRAIEAGLADSEAGRVTTVEEVRAEFGLPS